MLTRGGHLDVVKGVKEEKQLIEEYSVNARMNLTNATQNQSVSLCSPLYETTEGKVGKTLAYVFIMLASLLGNSAIVIVIFKTQSLRNTTSYLIANMAVSDLLLPLFAMPRMVTAVYFGSNRWLIGGNFGLAMCKLVPLFQDVSTAVSTQSLVLIAIDRFYSVFYPVKAAVMSLKSVKIALPFVWLIAIGIHSPYFYIYRIYVLEGESYCLLNWSPPFDDLKAQKFYFVVLSILLFILPLFVIATLYTAVIVRLKRQQFPGYQSETARNLRQKRNKAILQLCVVIVMVFIVCWTPFVSYVFLKFFLWETPRCGGQNAAFIVHFIAHSISAINPCVYFLFSSSYRQGLKDLFTYVSQLRPSSRVLPAEEIEQLEMRARARTFSSRAL